MSTIDQVRTRLASDVGGIAGIARVFQDEPNLMPAPPDMPCFILDTGDPFLTATSETNSSIDYTWHFTLTLLYKPEGLGNADENMRGLESFLKLTLDKLYANFTGGGTYSNGINKDTNTLQFSCGILTRANAPEGSNRVWGFTGNLDPSDAVDTIMDAGS